MTIVTRFAPSPTWYLHIWSLRTVLYNYLFAKQNNWKFMLRIEDTDRARYVEGSVENLIEILKIVWLTPDEWPNNPWDKWPYFQSERLDTYKKYIDKLIEDWKAYYCFCSSERLDELREEQIKFKLPTKYDKKCKYLTQEEIQANLDASIPYTIRLNVPDNQEIEFNDLIKWKIKINSKDVDDQVLLKSDWFPTYHLAVVVDDYLMWVTHIIRWDEWIPSTPKHILLYEAFSWEKPTFIHLPPLVWQDKKKLSKRQWDVSVESYLEKWYLVEALINYIALLWWNPKTTEEFFTMDELIKRFDIEAVHRAWAFFDIERLNFFNSHYIKNSDIDYVYSKLKEYLNKYDQDFLKKIWHFEDDYNKKILTELKTRIRFFKEFKDYTNFFYFESKLPSLELLMNPKMKIDDIEIVKNWLKISKEILEKREGEDFESIEEVKNIFVEKIANVNMKNWQVLWPLRCVLSWEEFSPWALELIYILWVEKSIQRINNTLSNI